MTTKDVLRREVRVAFGNCLPWRTHLSLGMDSPESRAVQLPPIGKVVQIPEVAGLHHNYDRMAS